MENEYIPLCSHANSAVSENEWEDDRFKTEKSKNYDYLNAQVDVAPA